jgi:hypothetical protein
MPSFRDSVQASRRATCAWQAAPCEAGTGQNAAQHDHNIRVSATQIRAFANIRILIYYQDIDNL